MLASGYSGKLFDIIKNMYEKAKTSVALIAEKQTFSPVTFVSASVLHISTRPKVVHIEKCNGLKDIENLQKEHLHEEIVTFFKLYILLYADDTVILAENPNDLQASLDKMKKYCDTFDLHINVNKTKILIFSRGKLRRHHIFNFGEFILDTVEEYNYLGLVFNYNAKLK